jgi:hypothetical protein
MLVYFQHGWDRLNLPLTWFYRIAVILGVAGLMTGFDVTGISFWVTVFPLLMLVFAGAIAGAILLGYFDRHRDGTFVPEEKKRFSLSGVSNFERWIQISLLMSLVESLKGKVPLAATKYQRYLEDRMAALGVVDVHNPDFEDWI